MQNKIQLDTRWSRRLRRGERPNSAELREHLLAMHRHHAGFTESCAGRCRDAAGRSSYEWLAEALDPGAHRTVLDLACGSGLLVALCRQRYGERIAVIGVDMSPEELALARRRVPDPAVALHCAMAQDMGFLDDNSIDLVLCHWGLTLMDPIEPVLAEVRRILRPRGTLAAIIDGEFEAVPGYAELHHRIYGAVQRECPGYGKADMGDARVRSAAPLVGLIRQALPNARVQVAPGVVGLDGPPEVLAREALDFFYASYVLSRDARRGLLDDLAQLFAAGAERHGVARFEMPINRLTVHLPACP